MVHWRRFSRAARVRRSSAEYPLGVFDHRSGQLSGLRYVAGLSGPSGHVCRGDQDERVIGAQRVLRILARPTLFENQGAA